MASRSSIIIAKKARSKAEVDFATWLMMAKLGRFDDLPANAQAFLTNYRARLEQMSEAESKVLAVREVYRAYFNEMGGTGAAPEQEARDTIADKNVVKFQKPRKPQAAPSVAAASARQTPRKPIPALLIFAVMVATSFWRTNSPLPLSVAGFRDAFCSDSRFCAPRSQDARRAANNATRLLRICSTSHANEARVVAP